jgi:hypothetical protein
MEFCQWVNTNKTRLTRENSNFGVMTTSHFAGLGEPVSSSRFLQQASSSTNINTLSHYPLQGNSQKRVKQIAIQIAILRDIKK